MLRSIVTRQAPKLRTFLPIHLHRLAFSSNATAQTPLNKNNNNKCPVNSHNEFDPLEEVIVGTALGAHLPAMEVGVGAIAPRHAIPIIRERGGRPFPKEMIEAAEKDLNNFCRVLKGEGVKVRRPEVVEGDIAKSYRTPDFESQSGTYAVMPRDNLLIIGDTIVESPMSWRSRYFEFRHYRKLITEYFHQGAKWIQPPRPLMSDRTFNPNYDTSKSKRTPDGHIDYDFGLTEHEPVFEAADFMRLGKDIFYQLSHGTNRFAIEWLKRTFPDYRFHRITCYDDPQAYHIDCSFVPLAPGKLMMGGAHPADCGGPDGYNGWFEFDGKKNKYSLPTMFKGWDVFVTPRARFPSEKCYLSSSWVASSNVLMLDEKRVFVEANESEVIEAFRKWGFEPIPVSLQNVLPFGGGFHCVTSDVRRRGELKSYF